MRSARFLVERAFINKFEVSLDRIEILKRKLQFALDKFSVFIDRIHFIQKPRNQFGSEVFTMRLSLVFQGASGFYR